MSLDDIGRILGVSKYLAALLVNGNRRISRERAELLARVLGVEFSACWRESDIASSEFVRRASLVRR